MIKINGHMTGLYNLLVDHTSDSVSLFSDVLGISKTDISIKLRRTDISAQVIISTEHIKKRCDTKIVFVVNRLDEYETHEAIQDIVHSLSTLIKLKDRRRKLTKIKSTIL